jgi:hypothetical protein
LKNVFLIKKFKTAIESNVKEFSCYIKKKKIHIITFEHKSLPALNAGKGSDFISFTEKKSKPFVTLAVDI